MPDIVVAGHICLDIIPEIPPTAGPLEPGRLLEVGPAKLSTGGAVSNVGIALTALQSSNKVRLVAKVGDDSFGRLIAELLETRSKGLSSGLVVSKGKETSYSVVISRPGHDRTFLHHAGANDSFAANDVGDDALTGARHLHFGYPPIMRRFYSDQGQELESLLSRARSMGLTTSLDMSLPDPNSDAGRANWEAILARALPHVHFFTPSLEELAFMFGDSVRPKLDGAGRHDLSTIQRLGTRCLKLGAKAVLIKCGDRGLYFRSGEIGAGELGQVKGDGIQEWPNHELLISSFEVPVGGTTGSGDAAVAGFLCLLGERRPYSCLVMAAIVAACCVREPDATSGIVPMTEAVELASAWKPRPFPFEEQLDSWRPQGHAWSGPNDSR